MIVTADGMGLITVEWWQLGVIGGGVFLAVLIADRISSHLDMRREARQDAEHGPYPCLKHLGTEVDGYEWWCWRQHGHEGKHLNQWGVDPSQDLDEPITIAEVAAEMRDNDTITIVDWAKAQENRIPETCAQFGCGPDYCPGGLQCRGDMLRKTGSVFMEELASEVNANGDAVVPDPTPAYTLCTYGEDGSGNPSGCWKPDGHEGPHMVLDQDTE